MQLGLVCALTQSGANTVSEKAEGYKDTQLLRISMDNMSYIVCFYGGTLSHLAELVATPFYSYEPFYDGSFKTIPYCY